MAKFSKSYVQQAVQRFLSLLRTAGLTAAAVATVPAQAAQLPERQRLEARVAQARQMLHTAAQAQSDAEPRTLLAQANNWNNWPNWSNWANWANG
jgi:hypothetical protein